MKKTNDLVGDQKRARLDVAVCTSFWPAINSILGSAAHDPVAVDLCSSDETLGY